MKKIEALKELQEIQDAFEARLPGFGIKTVGAMFWCQTEYDANDDCVFIEHTGHSTGSRGDIVFGAGLAHRRLIGMLIANNTNAADEEPV